jgi:hypothetical protein
LGFALWDFENVSNVLPPFYVVAVRKSEEMHWVMLPMPDAQGSLRNVQSTVKEH